MRQLVVLFSCVLLAHAEFSLTVYLRRLDVGQGYLLNGTHCVDTWNLGDQCNIRLQLGVCLGPFADPKNPCSTPTSIDLGTVTKNANSIDFTGAGTSYGSWQNPAVFPNLGKDAIYGGFALKVDIFEARGGLQIDSYQQIFDDGFSSNNFMYYSHQREMLDPTMLSVAWRATGDLPTPPPPPTTTEAPTTPPTTVTEPSTTEGPTLAPSVYKDCDEIANSTDGTNTGDGVYTISINGIPINVYCAFGSNVALTHIQGRGEVDTTSFAVTYDRYKSPIGTPDKGKNFWLGLDNMNYLTTQNGQDYSMMIEVCCKGTSIKQYYTKVKIGNSASGYMLTGSAVTTLGLNYNDVSDGYGTDLGKKFNTYASWDSDQSGDNDYCTIINDPPNFTKGSGGWWFGNCRENLNGQYYPASELNGTCAIQNYTRGSGIELVTKNVASPVIDGISYTRARMALYRGTATPLGVSGYC